MAPIERDAWNGVGLDVLSGDRSICHFSPTRLDVVRGTDRAFKLFPQRVCRPKEVV